MKVIKLLLLCSAVFLSLLGCEENNTYKARLKDPQLFHNSMQQLSDVIVYDIFSPPVASRVYMYPTIAAYAIMQKQYPNKYEDMAGQLSDFKTIPEINDPNIHAELAAIHAFLKVGTALIFSEDKIIDYRNSLYASLEEDGLPSNVKEASLAYGDLIAAHILAWADTDFYKQTRTYPKYTIQEGTAFWKPTPPDYMEGIEPHWNKIRTLVLATADQFEPAPPYPVDMSKDSPFYQELMEVYELGEKIDGSTEATEIASFWDCNPYVSHHRGHAMFATKKITPGGHWIGITKIAAKQAQSNIDESINAYARVSIALFDGFISCWNTKWNTLIVRPETIINEFLDETWLPLLQTPPFPEYTSGHSVISRASAVALTDIYGDTFSFADTTEEVYGLGVRSYDSFIAASEEAAVSRLYGGIHYRRAIDEGVKQGDAVGKFLVEKLKTLK